MARKFLTNIDLNTAELQNAVVQNLATAPSSGNKEGRIYFDTVTHKLRMYRYDPNQSQYVWTDLAVGGSAASSLVMTGDVTGTASVDPLTGIITIDTTVEPNSVALGTDTTGDYVAGINGTTDQIVVTNSGGETSTPTISLSDTVVIATSVTVPTVYVDTVAASTGASITFNSPIIVGGGITTGSISNIGDINVTSSGGQVVVSGSTGIKLTGALTVDNDAQFSGNVDISGDLNVLGKLNAVNREEINISDNTIRLNTGFTGSPSVDAGIIVERGTANDTAVIWNETADQWTITNDGSHYFGIARKFAAFVGDGAATSYDVVHNLATRDVTVQVYTNGSTYDVVETDIQMKDENTVTIAFADAPASNAYRVVIVG